jgi:2-C-methyl-D-erythritol 4-phosphate cytidylyltransferase
MNKITAIVLAAGQGKRMNSPVAKQFLILQEKPVLYYALRAFEESSVDEIILVTGKGQADYCRDYIVDFYHIKKVIHIVEGGIERYDSVYQALKVTNASNYVLIHDGARPFITADLIDHLIQQVMEYKACIIGTPVKETIKVVDTEGFITGTPNRNMLWTAQTPQAFECAEIRKAYDMFYIEGNKKELNITDDAMVYETYLKRPVKMILGDYNNLKITTPEDLSLAEEILRTVLYEKNKKIEQFFHE